jgi:hypothetical protein
MLYELDAIWVGFCRDIIFAADESHTGDMVDMAMSLQQPDRFQAVLLNETCDYRFFFRGIAPRINDGTFFGFIMKNIRVYLEGIKDKTTDLKHTQLLITTYHTVAPTELYLPCCRSYGALFIMLSLLRSFDLYTT